MKIESGTLVEVCPACYVKHNGLCYVGGQRLRMSKERAYRLAGVSVKVDRPVIRLLDGPPAQQAGPRQVETILCRDGERREVLPPEMQ